MIYSKGTNSRISLAVSSIKIGTRTALYRWVCVAALTTSFALSTSTSQAMVPISPFVQRKPISSYPLSLCKVPAPKHDIVGVTFYTDSNHSIIDPKALARDRALDRDLATFYRSALATSNAAIRDPEGSRETVACELRRLATWASADALLGKTNPQGARRRMWATTALAISYQQLLDGGAVSTQLQKPIGTWLKHVAQQTRQVFSRSPLADNLTAWASAASVTAGVATGDVELYKWGIHAARSVLMAVDTKGALPSELSRANASPRYHCFALTALALVVTYDQANGGNLARENNFALQRLSRFAKQQLRPDDTGAQASCAAGFRIYAPTKSPQTIESGLSSARPVTFPFLGDVDMLVSQIKSTQSPNVAHHGH